MNGKAHQDIFYCVKNHSHQASESQQYTSSLCAAGLVMNGKISTCGVEKKSIKGNEQEIQQHIHPECSSQCIFPRRCNGLRM